MLLLLTTSYNATTHVNIGVALATTTIFVDPSESWASAGQNFTININISDVIDLYGWEFKLNWTATILDAKDVVEGPFLKQGGNTFFTFKINNAAGYVIVDCTLLGAVPGMSGNGTLATIEFCMEAIGESTLDLNETTLINSREQTIFHTSIDGYCSSDAWLGDFDKDMDVDEDDLWHFCAAFIDYYKAHVKDPNCDFDNDCDIDEDDLWIFCGAFINYWKAQ